MAILRAYDGGSSASLVKNCHHKTLSPNAIIVTRRACSRQELQVIYENDIALSESGHPTRREGV